MVGTTGCDLVWGSNLAKLRQALESPRVKAFSQFVNLRGGLKFLLDLRVDAPAKVERLLSADQIEGLRSLCPKVHGEPHLREYIIDLALASREHPDLLLGASPRGALCLLRCARAHALLDGRAYFTHQDVQAVAQYTLAHRLILRPEAEIEGRRTADVVEELLQTVPVLDAEVQGVVGKGGR